MTSTRVFVELVAHLVPELGHVAVAEEDRAEYLVAERGHACLDARGGDGRGVERELEVVLEVPVQVFAVLLRERQRERRGGG